MPKYKPRRSRPRGPFKVEPEGAAAVVRGRYRYSLTRWWPPSFGMASRVAWVMLNPSTADALEDDPTIRRVRSFSESAGHSSFEVVNLFAYRTPSPSHLWSRKVPIVGRQNRDYLRQAIQNADRVIVAWGAAENRRMAFHVDALCNLFRSAGVRPWCLGKCRSGAPKHPLYLAAATPLERWPGE